MNIPFNFTVNDTQASSAIDKVIKKIEELGARTKKASSAKVSDIISPATLKAASQKFPELDLSSITNNLDKQIKNLTMGAVSDIQRDMLSLISGLSKLPKSAETSAAYKELDSALLQFNASRKLAVSPLKIEAKTLEKLSTSFAKIYSKSSAFSVAGLNVGDLSKKSLPELLSGIQSISSLFSSNFENLLKGRLSSLAVSLSTYETAPSVQGVSLINAELNNISEIIDGAFTNLLRARSEKAAKLLEQRRANREARLAASAVPDEPSFEKIGQSLVSGSVDSAKLISDLRTIGTSIKTTDEYTRVLTNEFSQVEKLIKNSALPDAQKAELKEGIEKLRVELADFFNTGAKEAETTAKVVDTATTEVKAEGKKARERVSTSTKKSKSKAKEAEPTPAPAPPPPPSPPAPPKPPVTPPSGSEGGEEDGSRRRRRRVLSEVDAAEKEINTALKRFSSFFNNITTTLRSTTKAANIETGGITTLDNFDTQLKVYTTQIGNFVKNANDYFNNVAIGGKKVAPDLFAQSVDIQSIANLPTVQARSQRINDIISTFSGQLGLKGEQQAAFEATLSRSLLELTSRYNSLSRSATTLNKESVDLAKSQANTLIQQNKYEDALDLLNKVQIQTIKRTADGRFERQSSVLGDIGFNVKDLTAAGLTKSQAQAIVKQYQGIQAEITKLKDIRRQDGSTGGGLGFNLPGFARFAGQALTAFSFLQFTIGTAVQTLTQFVDQANRLEKASATVSALSGNFTKYTQVLNIAQVQQAKFGGTLEEQLQGLSSLVPISKRYNVSLEQLDNIARRLAIIDPLQGFSGASIALKEFFSGDITSLSRRFEIDRATLNSIKEAGDRAEQLQELDKVLSQLGISQAVLEARTNTAAASFDRASAAWNNYTTLLGQQTQTVLRPAADAIAEFFGFAGDELEQNLANSQKYQDIIVNLRKVSNEARLLGMATSEINFDGFVSDGNSAFTQLETNSATSTREIILLKDSINTVIEDLNKIREDNGDTPFALLTADTKAAREEVYALGLAFKNLPIESIEKILSNRMNTGFLGSKPSDLAYTDFVDNYAKTLELLPGYSDLSFQQKQQNRVNLGDIFQTTQVSDADKLAAVEYSNQFLEIVKDEAFGSKAKQFISQNARLFGGDQFKNLTDRDKVIKYFTTLYEDVASGSKSVADLANEFNRLAETQIPVIKNTQVIINGIYDITDQLNKIEEPSKNLENATNLYNESLSVTKKFATDLYNAEMKNLALRYVAADLVEKNLISQDIRSRKLLQTNEEITATESMKLRAIYNADRAQAQFVLNQNKSVSAVQALNSLYGQLNISLEEAAKLAVEFSSSLSGITTGTLLPNLSLQDQLSFNRMALMGQVPGLAPQNQTDATNLLGTIFGNVLQLGEESSKTGESRAKRLADLEEKYIEDKRKAEEDYEKDRTRMAEEYEKRRKELLRESEVGKRESRSGFYRSLMGTEGLTDEQMQQASADYERLFQQASELRNQGEFQKAQALLSTGVEEILNRIQVQEDIAAEKQNIIDADEEIADLQKDLAKAKEQDDRAEIQRKIAKANQDKLDAENRIKQIEGVAKLQEDTDAQKIKDAKTLEETITTNYETELANRKKEYDEKLLEMETEYKKSVKNMSEADNTRAKKQLVNIMDLLMIQDYANSVMQQAQAELTYGPGSSQATAAKAIAEANRTATKIYFDNTGSVLAKDFETYANLIENQLQASDIQSGGGTKTPAKSPTIVATDANTDATKLNTLAVQRLNQILSGPNKSLYRIPE